MSLFYSTFVVLFRVFSFGMLCCCGMFEYVRTLASNQVDAIRPILDSGFLRPRLALAMDTKFEKANIMKEVNGKCTNLNREHQRALIDLLKKYKCLFDGTLGI